MERARFIEIAPFYYAAAIATFFKSSNAPITESTLLGHFYLPNEDDPWGGGNFLEHTVLREKAFQILLERGFLTEVSDEFGPTIYGRADTLDDAWEAAVKDQGLPFMKCALADGQEWVKHALVKVNVEYSQLNISEEDFVAPDLEWTPLPVERADPKLQAAIENLDHLIEEVRSNNGYTASEPKEREYVLEALGTVSEKLKSDTTTSIGFLRKFAFEPLSALIRRFKDAAIGLAAQATRSAIVAWLKNLELNGLHHLLSEIFKGLGLH